MAFIIVEGFDLYNGIGIVTGVQSRWSVAQSGGGLAMVAGRFGGQALQMSDITGGTVCLRLLYGTAFTQFATGFAMNHRALANIGNQPLIRLCDSAGAVQLSLYLSGTTQSLNLYRGLGTTLLASSGAGTISNQVWHYIEMVGSVDNAGGCEVFIDGVSVLTYTGDTQQTAIAGFSMYDLNCPDGSGGGSAIWYDDLYMTNTAVRVGERRIDTLRPMSDSAEQDFTPTPAGAGYTTVDDTTAVATDYIEGDTVGDKSYFGLVDLLETPDVIDAVQIIGFGLKTDASTRQIRFLVREGVDVAESADLTLSASLQHYNAVFTSPPAGGLWDAASVNAIEIGVKVST